MADDETRIIKWEGGFGSFYNNGGPPLSRDIYYFFADGDTNPLLAHVCTASGTPRWVWQGTGLHTLVSREPLHLEASIGWTECCGRHGFIRDGKWEPAGDGGWKPSDG